MSTDEPQYECSECGTSVSLEDKFCKNCGASLEETTAESAQTSQETTDTLTVPHRDVPVTPFESASSRFKLVTFLFTVCIFLDLVSMVSTYAQIELISGVREGRSVTTEAAEANDSRQHAIGVVQIVILTITSIFFLVWVHRAYRNLSALGATGLKYSTRWAVVGFFVPFLNFVRPFQVMTEIWKASDPIVSVGSSWHGSPSTPIIGQWWASYLASGVIGSFSFSIAKQGATIDTLLTTSWGLLIADMTSVIAALLAINMIKHINTRQELKQISLLTNV
jgi:hypothetical protein